MIYRGSPWETSSSPRMWGTPSPSFTLLPRGRFIPTHVGNTSTATTSVRATTVHPHACGEHAIADPGKNSAYGSSPRMWGTQAYRLIPTVIPRFIPTHVGNTVPRKSPSGWRTVHPHACGEHSLPTGARMLPAGSSPRMWGTLRIDLLRIELRRFIPTHVGNTSVGIEHCDIWAVHPHACGEHTYRTELFLKKKKHLEKSTASSSIPWSDPEAGMPPIAARRTTLDVDG